MTFDVYESPNVNTTSESDESQKFLMTKEITDRFKKNNPYVENVDMVNHPPHYTSHPSGVEAITITRHYDFTIGNAIKYLWRAGLKKDQTKKDATKEIEDLEKAIFYINDKINQLRSIQ